MRRRLGSVLSATLLLFAPALAAAQGADFTFFGPRAYDHPAAGPARAVETVPLPSDVTGPFMLRLQNGAGDQRVDAGWVFLNGLQIVGPDDLHPRVGELERLVTLQAVNELVVVIRGRAGTRVTLGLSGRLIPPVPAALAPDPLAVFAGATASVTATLAPTPRFAGALAVAVGDAGVATAPASVPFAAGQALVAVPVTGVARGSTALGVTLNGVTLASGVNVVAPLVTALAPDPLKVFAGATASVVATLAPAPVFAGALSVTVADAAVATAPLSAPFAPGQTLVPIDVSGVAAGATALTAGLNGASLTSQITVLPPPPQIAAVTPASAAAGSLVTLTGENFDPVPANNQVSFAGAGGSPAAAVIAATATQLTVRVPAAAASGPVTLANPRGTAQSPAFALLALNARFTATRAGLNAPLRNLGTPVTPFVQNADPGDALSFLVLSPPAKGTASVIGNRLVYQATAALNDVDQFPYRAVAADGSTQDGTALVKLFNSGNLGRCTQASTNVGGVVTRTNVLNCAFYGEVRTRLAAGGAPVSVPYIAVRPSSGAAPKAAVFLIGGGDFDLNFVGNAATGQASTIGGNFLVRTAQIFAEAGYLAIAMNKPSDLPIPGSIDATGDADAYRISVRHAVDILGVLREVNTDGLDVFIAGTSRGAISAVAANLIATAISLSSPVTRGNPVGTALFVNDTRHANLLPGFVQRPAHVLWNTLDQCTVTRPADSLALANALGAPGVAVTGGFINDTDICGAQHFHGFMGIEPTAVAPVTGWLNDRVAALAGDRRPDAAFASLPAAPGAALAIDLAALARDADGDALSFALSHVGSSLGGTVTLSGATATYTPPAGVTSGTDYFVYVVTDGRGGVGAAVVTVKIGG